MNLKLEFKVGKKNYKLYDHEAAALYNELSEYFQKIGALKGISIQKEMGDCVAEQREIGFDKE